MGSIDPAARKTPNPAIRAFTAVTKVLPERLESLIQVLNNVGDNPSENSYISLSRVKCLHFASWTILADDPNYPPLLVFEANYDGELASFLNELLLYGRPALDQIYSLCKDCPRSGTADETAFKQYLTAADHRPASFYVGLPDQTVASILNAVEVRRAATSIVDAARSRGTLQGLSPEDVWNLVHQYLQNDGSPPLLASPVTLEQEELIQSRNTILGFVFGIPILFCFSSLLIADLLAIRALEIGEGYEEQCTVPRDHRTFDETNHPQNHMVTLVDVKPGLVRLLTLKSVLWFFKFAGAALERSGTILGISTIHFVRWVLIDDEQRLLFLANYDGRWAAYLGDFIDCASSVLTAIWSNTKDFPPSKWLFLQGARQANEFKQWTRDHNLKSLVWYSAYPDSTVRSLRKDIAIRDGLASGQPTIKAENLLRLL
jgi:hypothetical protein